MTIIQIDFKENKNTVKRIEKLLENVRKNDINWNGAIFKIRRGEYTCIIDRDDATAAELFNEIQKEIENVE